jgi:NADH:ubiquinone oxidoreductase subunit 5 (subunit L)/multisubunit Na+/H+ antiporter MnhA subunit
LELAENQHKFHYTLAPDAMAGPTPVSALIHAATMVTAGIFMITRLNYLFDLAPDVQNIIAIVDITSLVAATIALVQTDIKGSSLLCISIGINVLSIRFRCIQ